MEPWRLFLERGRSSQWSLEYLGCRLPSCWWGSRSGSASSKKLDPDSDPHRNEKLTSDPHSHQSEKQGPHKNSNTLKNLKKKYDILQRSPSCAGSPTTSSVCAPSTTRRSSPSGWLRSGPRLEFPPKFTVVFSQKKNMKTSNSFARKSYFSFFPGGIVGCFCSDLCCVLAKIYFSWSRNISVKSFIKNTETIDMLWFFSYGSQKNLL